MGLEFIAISLEPYCKSWGFFGSPNCPSQALAAHQGNIDITATVVDNVTMVPRTFEAAGVWRRAEGSGDEGAD